MPYAYHPYRHLAVESRYPIPNRLTALRVQPPAMSLGEVKDFLRVTGHDQDSHLRQLLAGVQDDFEQHTGMCLTLTQFELHLDGFPIPKDATPVSRHEPIRLPKPPLIALESITYTDTAGDSQTLTIADDIQIINRGNQPVYLYRKRNAGQVDWPDTYHEANTVRIVWTAGFSDGAGLGGESSYHYVPADVKNALGMWCNDVYREGEISDKTLRAVNHVMMAYTSGNTEGH